MLIVLAGPNGSGKSTFFQIYLEELGLPYVNADRIAATLRRSHVTTAPEDRDRQAFVLANELRSALVAAGLSFCTETVFSDPDGHRLRFLKEARDRGFVRQQ